MCAAFVARNTRFSLVRQERRLGWVGNVNDLLRRVDGEYCFFAFHDDLLEPTFVEQLVLRLEERPSAVLAFCDMDTTFPDGHVEISRYDLLEGVADPVERGRRIVGQEGDWWTPHRGVFRASVGRSIGGLRQHLAGEFMADWPWLLHLSLYGEFTRVPSVLCHKHYREASLSRTWGFSRRQQAAVALSCLREALRARVRPTVRLAVAAVVVRWLAGRALRSVLCQASSAVGADEPRQERPGRREDP